MEGEINSDDGCDGYGGGAPLQLLDLIGGKSGKAPSAEEVQRVLDEQRCASQARGSVKDPAGITCHFCRQKNLCAEEGCPRCSTRDASKACIGKTECSRCMSATGQFCRGCLHVRYGLNLDDVRRPDSGWLCPHCYQKEHPMEVGGSVCRHGGVHGVCGSVVDVVM